MLLCPLVRQEKNKDKKESRLAFDSNKGLKKVLMLFNVKLHWITFTFKIKPEYKKTTAETKRRKKDASD